VMAAADQVFLNGGPLLVMAGGGSSKSAGIVFAATMLIRVPGFLFQGLTAAMLPSFTKLNAADAAATLERAVLRLAVILVGIGVALSGVALAIGPQTMELLYGPGYDVARIDLALLALGVGCYLASGTYSQGLLALNSGRGAALAWSTGALLFVALYVVLPGDALERISTAFLAASLVNVLLLAAVLRSRVR
jgi:O-antigen/teichoic acid export membrane protein